MTPFRAKLILFTITFVFGGIALAFAVGDLKMLLNSLDGRDELIVSEPYAMSGMMLGIMALAIAAACIISSPASAAIPAKSSRGKPPLTDSKWTKRLLIFVACCIVGAGLAPTIQFQVVDAAASRRSYTRCPAISWPRRQPDRWASDGSRCPKQGTAAET